MAGVALGSGLAASKSFGAGEAASVSSLGAGLSGNFEALGTKFFAVSIAAVESAGRSRTTAACGRAQIMTSVARIMRTTSVYGRSTGPDPTIRLLCCTWVQGVTGSLVTFSIVLIPAAFYPFGLGPAYQARTNERCCRWT